MCHQIVVLAVDSVAARYIADAVRFDSLDSAAEIAVVAAAEVGCQYAQILT